jgi:GNAT superfamily N-acetyltransferase
LRKAHSGGELGNDPVGWNYRKGMEAVVTEQSDIGAPGLRLRFAREDDVGVVQGFIRELVEYEKLAHEVVADEATLRGSLFGDRQVAEVLIAEYHNARVGFALFFHNFSTFLGRPGIYLEDLCVKPEARGRGIGKASLAKIARLATQRGCGRVEWWVLDWNRTAIEFYDSLGAVPMDEWTVFRLTGEALEDLADVNRAG